MNDTDPPYHLSEFNRACKAKLDEMRRREARALAVGSSEGKATDEGEAPELFSGSRIMHSGTAPGGAVSARLPADTTERYTTSTRASFPGPARRIAMTEAMLEQRAKVAIVVGGILPPLYRLPFLQLQVTSSIFLNSYITT